MLVLIQLMVGTCGEMLEADEEADAGVSIRGCKVSVENSGAAGGGGGGSENPLGGAKEEEAEAGTDESVCRVEDGGGFSVLVVGDVPARRHGRGKLAVLRRSMLSSLDGRVTLLGTIDDHQESFSFSFCTTRSRSGSASLRCWTPARAERGLDGGVGAELLRFSGGIGFKFGEGRRGWEIGGSVVSSHSAEIFSADAAPALGGTARRRTGRGHPCE
jgi:hypothetical protein